MARGTSLLCLAARLCDLDVGTNPSTFTPFEISIARCSQGLAAHAWLCHSN